jgi:UDP-glucose:glycoprotein glucosyltransferase
VHPFLEIVIGYNRGAFGKQEALLPFDHILSKDNKTPTVVLYADISTSDFAKFHTQLVEKVNKNEISYILRYRPPVVQSNNPLYVSGFGVELVLKSTEYKVVDDRDIADSTGKYYGLRL